MIRQLKTVLYAFGGIVVAGEVARLLLRKSRRISLEDRVVFITGGSRGLGIVLAREFARRGARVAVCARSERELERVRQEFADAGHALIAEVCDVGVRAEIARAIEAVRHQIGPIDILVNNAGTILVGPAENQDTEALEDVMRTNFWGPHYAIAAVLDQMKARRFGRIVNIASVGGKIAFPHLLPYSASKFALVGYSQGLRAELAKDNILVTTVCPGLMRTGSPRNAEFIGQSRKEYAWFTVSDSLPIASIGAKKAARRIVDACIHGDAEIHVGLAAKLGSLAQGLAPGATVEALSLVNRLMPRAVSGHPVRRKGAESESPVTNTIATKLTRDAELANNQL